MKKKKKIDKNNKNNNNNNNNKNEEEIDDEAIESKNGNDEMGEGKDLQELKSRDDWGNWHEVLNY